MPAPKLAQFRSRPASLWQSAVDEVIAKQHGSSPAASFLGPPKPVMRPAQSDVMIASANDISAALDTAAPLPTPTKPSPAAGIADIAKFCSVTAFKLAEARVKAFFTHDNTELNKLQQELGAQFGSCDPRWAQVVAVYVAHRIAAAAIPYRRHQNIGDFVITGRLPDQARVALVGDWGTGDQGAARLLDRIASRKPQAVIHLGDVYYSGTEHEFQNYFYAIWQSKLGLPKVAWGQKLTDLGTGPATFTLAGNHDMYAGGEPFYTVLDMLGQPASYFCLRNNNWQFIALDTGLHDSDPTASGNVTFLEDTEVQWLMDKIATAGGRKTVLLSHHQPFSAFEKIGDDFVNAKLLGQVGGALPQTTAWFWGHEHNLVIYGRYQGLLGRCVGHGAFPVGVDEVKKQNPDIPVEAVQLSPDKVGGLFQHGYVIMDIDGASAETVYYQYDDQSDTEIEQHRETL